MIRSLVASLSVLALVSGAASAEVICNAKFQPTNIRSGPGAKDFAVVDQLANGAPVTVQERVTNAKGFVWARITFANSSSGDSTTGFVMDDSLAQTCDQKAAPAAPAAEGGDSSRAVFLAYRGLSHMLRNDGNPSAEDKASALADFGTAARMGNMQAQYYLAKMYFNGDGVAVDQKTAVDWGLKSARQGYAEAQVFVGRAFVQGQGVEQDPATGLDWVVRAADQGNEDALAILKRLEDLRKKKKP